MMAQFRQSGGDRFAGYFGNGADAGGGGGGGGGGYGRGQYKGGRLRRHGKGRKFPIGAVVVILALVLVVTFFSFGFISGDGKENEIFLGQDDDINNDLDFLSHSRTERHKVLKFGRGLVIPGRDSRYWDHDDRRRDKEYDGDTSELSRNEGRDKVEDLNPKNDKNGNKKPPFKHQLSSRTTGLYNEIGRDELKHYEAEYETSLKNLDRSSEDHKDDHPGLHNMDMDMQNEADPFDEYDDGMDLEDSHEEEFENKKVEMEENESENVKSSSILGVSFSTKVDKDKPSPNINSFPLKPTQGDNAHDENTKKSAMEKKSDTRRKGKRRKYSGSSCEMKFLNSTVQLVEPIASRKFKRFQLHYTEVEDRPIGEENWKPKFAGHQSLQEREESFYARDQKMNCGFVKGPQGYPSTGFDLAEDDLRYMKSCHVAVSSCIFGNSDNLRSPTNKAVTRLSRKNVCFVIFVDEKTLETLSSEGQSPDRTGFIGLWKVVVVKNLPYDDMRRVGKIPKFLTHRLFPSARYSIWLDSKLRLQSDPLLILEYFLWRKNFEYAISNHYDRHCVWEEVLQNKKLNKFNHTIIDQQFEFYKADGLRKFNASNPDRVLPSNVPEGSFIVRAHTPMSNLFSCLWFNEVDRFTPRDQLSFAYTYIKLRRMNPEKPFYLNMFKDCERRSIAKLYRHRPEDKRNLPAHETE